MVLQRTITAELKGIHNMGNTCYINTLFQCLGHCPSFIAFIIDGDYQKHRKTLSGNMIDELRELYTNIQTETVIPKDMLKCMYAKLNTSINIFEQNDINELLMIFIDKLNDEIARPICNQQSQIYNNNIFDLQRRKMDYNWYETHKNDYSELKDLMFGQIISQIVCGGCKKIHHNYEVFMNLMLSIEGCSDIYQSLERMFNDEYVNALDNRTDTQWKCDDCELSFSSKKTVKLWRLPKILTISFKRFNSNLTKNNEIIVTPLELDLSKYNIGPSSSRYVLKSMAYHGGSFQFGHYIAMCLSVNGKWQVFDDDTVKEIDNIENALKTGYVYFYEQV